MSFWGETESKSKKASSRFYCSNTEQCNTAEKALSKAGVHFVKIDSEHHDPVLITGQGTCRGLSDILGYAAAFSAIKKKYSVDWS